jgi:pimeloyl-[acyl-carrier protein] methyl ester esterase
MRLLLIPGLDGTGALFQAFCAVAPPGIELVVLALPRDASDYPTLVRALAAQLQPTPNTVILAESFGGPLALALAAVCRPLAVILVNSFVVAPIPAWCCRLVPAALFALRPPSVVLRAWLLGPTASDAQLDVFRANLSGAPTAVLAARIRSIGMLDATADLARLTCPLVCLRGSEDRLVSERSLKQIRAGCPSVEIHRIAGPHLLLQVAPDRAWAVLQPVLSRVATG